MNIKQKIDEFKNLIIKETKNLGKPLEYDKDYYIIHQPKGNHSKKLAKDEMAIYTFLYNDEFLKIGQAGMNSNTRYKYQHYKDYSDKRKCSSTLAKSLINDKSVEVGDDVGSWIKNNCERIDVIIKARETKHENVIILNFLEGLFQYKYYPKYEG